MRRRNLALLSLLLLPTVQFSQNPSQPPGNVRFRVRHFGFSWIVGTFGDWSANIDYDPEQPELASVTAFIKAGSLDTGHPLRDSDLRRDYLAVDSFPGIIFRSTMVERAGLERLKVLGDLTIGEITRPVVLDAEVRDVVKPEGRRKAFTATTTINRQDFGIFRNSLLEWMAIVGDEVEVTIETEADSK